MKITFIGTTSCIPDIGHEMASFVINGKILVDTGWCNILKMREYGFDPINLEFIIVTHFHQDHYIGLPQLLYYLGLQKAEYKKSLVKPLSIIGPSIHLKGIVDTALKFLQISRFPELSLDLNLVPLSPGETYQNNTFCLDTFSAKHVSGRDMPEQVLVCKFTEMESGKSFAFTGDTSFHPPIAKFVKNVPVLIHDAAHSSPEEAASIAKRGNVGKLYMIHCSLEKKEEILVEAREIFPHSFLAEEGESVEI